MKPTKETVRAAMQILLDADTFTIEEIAKGNVMACRTLALIIERGARTKRDTVHEAMVAAAVTKPVHTPRCSVCGKEGCKRMNHAGWDPRDEGHG